jgi:tetraacyldisaccharide 4'-kinase
MFRLVAVVRVRMYASGMLRSSRVDVPVLSIGNLRVGGSGKTPFAIHLVCALRARGRRPVVVSRGYGAALAGPSIVVPCAQSSPAEPEGSGSASQIVDAKRALHVAGNEGVADEALLVALRTGSPVVTDPDRVAGARRAVRSLGADVIVLDDGFQHLRLARDLDLVLVSGDDANARCLPAGPLREPWSALDRAGLAIATGTGVAPVPVSVPSVAARFEAVSVVESVESREGAPPESLDGKTVVAAAGIARPERFACLLEDAGASVRTRIFFDDHHRFDASDAERIASAAAGADAVVVTEKDLVKLSPLWRGEVPLRALRIDIRLDDEATLWAAIEGCGVRLDALGREPHHPETARDRSGEED